MPITVWQTAREMQQQRMSLHLKPNRSLLVKAGLEEPSISSGDALLLQPAHLLQQRAGMKETMMSK